MANNAPGPWAPDPATAPGVLGERGSSAFAGNSSFAAYDATPNAGATTTQGGDNAYGDAPTSHSDPTATAFVYRTPKSNQAYEDERRAARA